MHENNLSLYFYFPIQRHFEKLMIKETIRLK